MRSNPEFHDFDKDTFKAFLADRELRLQPVAVKDLTFVGNGEHRKVTINGQITADSEGFKSVCKFIGAPPAFMRRAPIDLVEQISERLLPEVSKSNEIIVNDGKVVGTKRVAAPYQSPVPVIDAIFKEIPKVESVKVFDLGLSFDASIICKDVTIKPKVNDITRGGVQFFYSEFMYQKPRLAPFTERLVCLNGMTHRESLFEFEFDDLDSLISKLSVSVEKSINYIKNAVEPNLKKAAEIELDGVQAIRRIFKQRQLSAKLLDSVLAAYLVENDGTAFGVLQAFTRAANQMKYNSRTKLQDAGAGELVAIAQAHCPTCYAELQ